MSDPVAVSHDSHGSWQPDLAIAELAGRQHGVVALAQLRALGLGRGEIEHRMRRHRLHRVQPEVYAVGHAVLSQMAVWMAAVLAGGGQSVLSHWSAASLWRMRSGAGPRSHVTVPRRRRSTRAIGFHFAELPDDEVSEKEGIPVTVPARVMLDLAPHLSIPSLHRALERAQDIRPWRGPSIPDLLARYPRRAGTPKLRELIAKPTAMTRSGVEAQFLYLLEAWGLPRPQMNLSVLGFEVDCVWRSRRLIVELDVFETHGSRAAFESDRRRDLALEAAGWRVVRITAQQLEEEPHVVRRRLERLLER